MGNIFDLQENGKRGTVKNGYFDQWFSHFLPFCPIFLNHIPPQPSAIGCLVGGGGGGNRAVNSQPRMGQSTLSSPRRCEILLRGGRRVGQEGVRDMGTQQRHQTGGGATQTHRTREPHQGGQGRAHQTRRRGTARQERLPERREQGTRMERMVERAHGRQRQQRGWLGQPAPSLPGARATPAHPALGGGVSRSPDGLFAQQEREPIRGRPTVRGKRTYGGRPGQRVEE